MVTILLNILCETGLGVVSWIIVFIPFILMTVMVSILLYIFGLNATTGKINYPNNNINNITYDALGNILIYDPEYRSSFNKVYYKYPNIIVSNSQEINTQSSSPSYQS
jgi:hypothetical protein